MTSKSTISNLFSLTAGDILVSIKIKPSKKFIRVLNDRDNNPVNIYKLKVERNLRSGDKWIVCLYKDVSEKEKYVFYLDLELCKVRFHQSRACKKIG